MPDFESGAFNRALPPLRVITYSFNSYVLVSSGVFASDSSGVRSGVHSVSRSDQSIDRRRLVLAREMRVPHDHLECPVPKQLGNRAQIHTRHNKSTGKRMAVAMPGILLNLGLFERGREPSARPCKESPVRAEGKTGSAPGRFFSPRIRWSAARATEFRRNGARIAVLGPEQMKLPALEIHLVPAQAVLLANPHPGTN